MAAPEPQEIYERTRDEGRRRLSRPLLELFTENFLVPLAGLERRSRRSWLKLGELWAATLVLNVAAGAFLAILLTSHGVLREGTGEPLTDLAGRLVDTGSTTLFASAVIAGALLTLMTWFVAGNLVGGLSLVTFARFAQALGSGGRDS